jgi:hypothetical protein
MVEVERGAVVVGETGGGGEAEQGGLVGGIGREPDRPPGGDPRQAIALEAEERLAQHPAGVGASAIGRETAGDTCSEEGRDQER